MATTLQDPRVGTAPSYVPLGPPGCYRGVNYQPVIVDDGELVVYIGPAQYVWRLEAVGHAFCMHLFNAYTGEPYHNADFVAHVDRVCDRRLGVIGS